MTLTDAIQIVQRDAQASVTPTLEDEEIEGLLTETMYAQVWASGTAYQYGDRVVPSTRTGYHAFCIIPGTSGSVQPTAFSQGTLTAPLRYGTRVQDGSATWELRAPDFDNLYDVRQATYLAWLLKAGKASEYAPVAQDGQSFHDEQIYQHCNEMAKRYRSVRLA